MSSEKKNKTAIRLLGCKSQCTLKMAPLKKAYEYRWWPQLHYVVPCCCSSPHWCSQSCRASSLLCIWVWRDKQFEICKNYYSRQDFLLCAIPSQFATAFYIHILHGNWIMDHTESGYFFLRFFEDDFLKLSLRRGASNLSLSKIVSSFLLHWSPKHNNNMWIWNAN